MNKKTPHWFETRSKLFFLCFSLIRGRIYFTVSELLNIRFSLAHDEVEDLNILLKSIYCISGPFKVHLKSLVSTFLSSSDC